MSARTERAAEAARLYDGGARTQVDVARMMGLSRSYVSALLIDPDGSQERARKDSYRGACRDCGAPTDGSNGRALTPERCAACAADYQHEERRHWTAERVIDAIRRFAAANGRPPVASEWINADPANGYPPRAAVYRIPGKPSRRNPFASWADAIEAAGFPRPLNGHYQIVPRPGDRRAKAASA